MRRGAIRDRTDLEGSGQRDAAAIRKQSDQNSKTDARPSEPRADDAEASRGWTLRGRIVRQAGTRPEGGSPVSGARVSVALAPAWPVGPAPRVKPPVFAPRETKSATDGSFELKELPPQAELLLEAGEPGAGYFVMRVTLPAFAGEHEGVRDAGAIGLETGCAVRVLVRDEKEQPVRGAKVWLTHRSTVPQGLRGLELAGNPRDLSEGRAGEYLIDRVPPREHLLRVIAPGFAVHSQAIEIKPDLVHTVLLTRGRHLAGRVLATSGEPVAGAIVRVDGSSLPSLVAVTDAEGRFAIEQFPAGGEYVLDVNADGFCPTQHAVTAEDSETEVRLAPEAALAGRAVEATDERPIAGVRVAVATSRGASRTDFAVTDASGRFAIHELQAGAVSLVAEHSEHVPALSDLFQLEPGKRVEDIVFRLERGHTLGGIVRAADSGLPLAGARVVARQGASDVRVAIEKTVTTDSAGVFELQSLREGPGTLDAHVSPYRARRAEFTIVPSRPERLEVSLERGGVIVGRVVGPDGSPVAGALLSLWKPGSRPDSPRSLDPAETLKPTTDEAGAFQFSGLLIDAVYNLRAERDGFLPEVNESIPAEEEASASPIEVRLRRGARVRVRVRDAAAAAISGAQVSVCASALDDSDLNRSPSMSDMIEVTSDTDGLATFGPLEPGRHWLLVAKEGRAPPGPRTIELEEGALAEAEVVFPAGHKLEGRVFDDQGQPLEGVNVSLDWADHSASISSRPDGALAIEGVPEGPCFIRVEKSGWYLRPSRVDVPSKPLSLRMEPLALLKGVVENAAGELLPDAKVTLAAFRAQRASGESYSTYTDISGQFELRCAPGASLLEVNFGGHPAWSQKMDLQPRRVQSIRVRLELPCRIEGVAVDAATSEPVAGCHLLLVGEPGGSTELLSFATLTGAGGEIQLDALAPGRYSLFADDDSRPFAGTLEGIIVPRAGVKQVRLVLTKAQGIRGYVTDDGAPAPGITVTMTRSDSADAHTLVTGACGRFEAVGLVAGIYEVRAVAQGRASTPRRVLLEKDRIAHVASELGRVELEDGSIAEVEIELGKVRVAGQVRRAGEPVPDVEVSVECTRGDEEPSHDSTSESGEYELWLDDPGDCEVTVWAAGDDKLLLRTFITIPAGTTDHRLDLDLDG